MTRFAWLLLVGCGTAHPTVPAVAKSRGPHAESPAEAGAVLAAVPIRDGKLDVPNDWDPAYPGLFPANADELHEVWSFANVLHCHFARYERDLPALSAAHPKWSTLVAALKVSDHASETALSDGPHKLELQRVPCHKDDCAFPPITLSVCTTIDTSERGLIMKALIGRIPALKDHEALLQESVADSASYRRSAGEAAIDLWLVGDEGSLASWRKFLTAHGLVKPGDKLESTNPSRRYWLQPHGQGWTLQVTADAK